MHVVYVLVFWARALVSSAASVACLLICLLSCLEFVHRSATLNKTFPKSITLENHQVWDGDFGTITPFPEPTLQSSVEIDGFDQIISNRFNRSSEAVKAAKKCDLRTFRNLIDNGVDVFSADGNGELPLAWAVRSNCRAIVESLVQRGADVMKPEYSGLSPLDWAKKESNFELISLFRETVS